MTKKNLQKLVDFVIKKKRQREAKEKKLASLIK